VSADDVYAGFGGRSILDRMRLDGRAALVTGAGQGIGRAFAHALGEAGASVAVIDKVHERAETVAAELERKGIRALPLAADVADPDSVTAMVERVTEELGGLQVAINNAGVNPNSAAEDTGREEWDTTFAVNSRGVFICCQAEGRVMLRRSYGKIVNTASIASFMVPHPQRQAAYNASKAAVVQLTRSLAAEWADRGVRVNSISPGLIRTALIEESDLLRPLLDDSLQRIPLGRVGEVTDLQGAVVYLASEASDGMTGHNMVIDGGETLW